MIQIIKKQMIILTAAIVVILFFALTGVPARVRMNRPACTLSVGESLQLKASILEKSLKTKRIVFKSSKPAVASVTQKGKVTAKKIGTARITASVTGTDLRGRDRRPESL